MSSEYVSTSEGLQFPDMAGLRCSVSTSMVKAEYIYDPHEPARPARRGWALDLLSMVYMWRLFVIREIPVSWRNRSTLSLTACNLLPAPLPGWRGHRHCNPPK